MTLPSGMSASIRLARSISYQSPSWPVTCTPIQPSWVGFFSDVITAPPGVARTLVPLGSVSVISTLTLQACFSALWARQAVAGVSARKAHAAIERIFIEFPGSAGSPGAARWKRFLTRTLVGVCSHSVRTAAPEIRLKQRADYKILSFGSWARQEPRSSGAVERSAYGGLRHENTDDGVCSGLHGRSDRRLQPRWRRNGDAPFNFHRWRGWDQPWLSRHQFLRHGTFIRRHRRRRSQGTRPRHRRSRRRSRGSAGRPDGAVDLQGLLTGLAAPERCPMFKLRPRPCSTAPQRRQRQPRRRHPLQAKPAAPG